MKGFADRTRTPLTRHGHAHRRRAVMAAHITRITLLTLLTGLTRPDHGTPTRSTDVSPPLKPLREWQRAWCKWLQVGGMGAFLSSQDKLERIRRVNQLKAQKEGMRRWARIADGMRWGRK